MKFSFAIVTALSFVGVIGCSTSDQVETSVGAENVLSFVDNQGNATTVGRYSDDKASLVLDADAFSLVGADVLFLSVDNQTVPVTRLQAGKYSELDSNLQVGASVPVQISVDKDLTSIGTLRISSETVLPSVSSGYSCYSQYFNDGYCATTYCCVGYWDCTEESYCW